MYNIAFGAIMLFNTFTVSSHIKLARHIAGQKQILTIPNHTKLDTGTCKAIFRQASRYINLSKLYLHYL